MSDPKLISQAKVLEAVTIIALVLLALNLLRLVGVVAVGFAAADAIGSGDLTAFWPELNRFLGALVGVLPTLIYLGGVWAAQGLFSRVARGELFSAANSKSLADIGGALLWGATAAMVIVPWLQSWIDGEYGYAGVRIEQETLVLAVIGGAVLMFGRMTSQARRLQSELDEII
ncbi:MAG: DUF2975 domain-containing protein [Caulobacter sp.]|nr:DUF2975 domain-containing protein [Caulobacter sp.]